MELEQYIAKQKQWSSKTFGSSNRTTGIVKHIQKELIEVEDNPKDLHEWVDVMILAMDGAWRNGFTPEEICNALTEKQNINISREWPKVYNENEPSEHIKH